MEKGDFVGVQAPGKAAGRAPGVGLQRERVSLRRSSLFGPLPRSVISRKKPVKDGGPSEGRRVMGEFDGEFTAVLADRHQFKASSDDPRITRG